MGGKAHFYTTHTKKTFKLFHSILTQTQRFSVDIIKSPLWLVFLSPHIVLIRYILQHVLILILK